jgi:methylphosphotriester-DNA--protein-cysteine methyltransferase
MAKRYRLIGPDRRIFESAEPGTLGGTRAGLYGRLDCPSALRALARPGATYARRRVFFADAASAVAAGFRPCAVCLPEDYRAWKAGAVRRVTHPRSRS